MMGDGEHVSHVFNVGSMDDVGTRMEHLTELYELWQMGIDILDRYDSRSTEYLVKRQELVNARDMLYFHMTKDYKESKE
jgi:hypothetical protein